MGVGQDLRVFTSKKSTGYPMIVTYVGMLPYVGPIQSLTLCDFDTPMGYPRDSFA